MLSRRGLLLAGAAALTAPGWLPGFGTPASAAGDLPVTLQNDSGSGQPVYAYISGSDTSGWPGFVTADGTFQRLASPSATLTPVPDYAIALGASGSSTTVVLGQYVIGGRVWFSVGEKIRFFVNPPNGNGVPGLVQPGFTASDPNWTTDWTFCEFTYNSANLYANISYVDLVASPISMRTTGAAGDQSVSPLPSGALAAIASGLTAQHQSDGAPWDTLVATDTSGAVLRVMAPTHATTDFGGYWNSYLDRVWTRFTTTPLTIDTQSQGVFTGTVSDGVLTFAGLSDDGVAFTRPSAVDVFGCNSGPLYNSGPDARGAVAARLGAALNRSTLLLAGGENQPGGVGSSQYYTDPVTNHYARLVHAYSSVGYAFPYDDVGPTGSAPVDGHLQDPAPTSWTISLGSGSGSSSGPGGGGGGTETVSWTAPAAQNTTIGTAVSLQLSATDSAGKALTYSTQSLPPGLTVSAAGLVSGAPTQTGNWTVSATAGSGTTAASTTFGWTVTPPTTGGCGALPPWNPTTSYVPGDKVGYGGHQWNSTWYSTGATPGAAQSWACWSDQGPC
ncbi:beta-1,3-glucanase family protein [Kitasatospora viridis]|uniref:Carbohydrate binding protein n=1 Tax=Kitasatospora viridis TaxID=281105 RepID=A0A561SET3_9ACTN|nr:beta-1,3-glucanase family protein [Kitasatospora viridis]TWF73369.1 carbohydrate binding protein [Kitasatospora viridis]